MATGHAPMHPYKHLPNEAFWRRSVASLAASEVDPVGQVPFGIGRSDKVATAGSCFAQHIARYLRESGFHFMVTEKPHPLVPDADARDFGYGVFTARYGNIYTSRQMLQLFQRSFDKFRPAEDYWYEANGAYVDPFRPQIQPGGFSTLAEYQRDRAQHFAAVREAWETLDVFVFTLGLTECWMSKADGAAYPICPGVAAGQFDGDRYELVNLTVEDVVADLGTFIGLLRSVNADARIVLTVSPVPLVATAVPRHVLWSTAYSKAVLRVACESVLNKTKGVSYFPSYEIVTGGHSRGSYFADDLRSVKEEGVAHVMRLFLKHYGGLTADNTAAFQSAATTAQSDDAAQHLDSMSRIIKTLCDEELLDAAAGGRSAG